MEQNSRWGSDVCNYLANSTALKIVKNMMERNGMNTLRNAYCETDFISSEDFILTESGDIFSKKDAYTGSFDAVSFYEALMSNGEFLRFAYRPFAGNGTFENILFKHHDETGKEVFCREYFDHEIVEMIQQEPDHILVKSIENVCKQFHPLPEPEKTESKSPVQKQL